MPPTKAEALREQREAAEDIREDGVPALVRFDRNWQVSGRQRPAPDWVDVSVHVLFDKFAAGEYDGEMVLSGDLVLWIPEYDLAELRGLATLPIGGVPVRTGWRVLVGTDPTVHPAPGGLGVREFNLLRVLDTATVGGWPVLYKVHARG